MRPVIVPFRRGFTLIEILVVIAIIGIIAGVTLPRLTGNALRTARLSAEEIADLLTLFAHRDSMGSSNLALGYDPDAGAIMLLELRGDPLNPQDPPAWLIDPFVPPVILPDGLIIREVRQDGMPLDVRDWFVPLAPGQVRPTIEIDLAFDGETYQTTIYLGSYALAAQMLAPDEPLRAHRLPVDLDAQGRDREVW